MKTNTQTQIKDIDTKNTVLGGGFSDNHNETLVRAKDLAPKGVITGGAITTNHNETLVRAKSLTTKQTASAKSLRDLNTKSNPLGGIRKQEQEDK